MKYELNEIEEGRLRIVITSEGGREIAVLYFERAKTSFQNKPLSMNSWRCVDAKAEGLYDVVNGDIPVPTEIIKNCQDLIRGSGF
jgi:hypothetical protein